MSPNVTFKSTEDRVPQPAAPGQALERAPSLAGYVRTSYTPSHGTAPARLPSPPSGLLDLGTAAALRVMGPDRETWMQGMQTADVAAIPYGSGAEGSFLDGKGRLVAEGTIFRLPEEIVVLTLPARIDALQAHLDRLLIMEDCEISHAEGLRRMLFCPGEEPLRQFPDVTGAPSPLGLMLLVSESRARELVAALPAADPAAVEAYRVAIGLPGWGTELDEESTPVEAGLDREISFEKGCYVGQEVIAMATFRGRVSWNLVRLQVDGTAPPVGARLDPKRAAQGKRGRVTSALQLGDVAVLLGYVHRELMAPGTKVALEDGRIATVLGLPYGSRPGAGVCA
ncbi:MAG: YgfZ/GcvT domain-containing protein [Myxococcales bacterium]